MQRDLLICAGYAAADGIDGVAGAAQYKAWPWDEAVFGIGYRAQEWKLRCEQRSQRHTTEWGELLRV